jgi:hypothetical protein
VRKLCNQCKEKHEPTQKEKEIIEKTISALPEKYKTEEMKNPSLWKAKDARPVIISATKEGSVFMKQF